MEIKAIRLLIAFAVLFVGWRATGTAHANGVAFVSGDPLASVGLGRVKHYLPDGTLKDTVNDGSGSFYVTGMCFDTSGNVYVTNFTAGTISKIDPGGNVVSASWAVGLTTPESCVVDSAGNMYVSQPFGSTLVKFSSTGTVLATYAIGRTDWLALAADNCTMHYTDESSTIHAYNVRA
jgi:DNA-binding beta-propeller fold protein YncE